MPDFIEIGKIISNAGGWTAFVILVVVVGVVAWRSITNGTLLTKGSHDAIVKAHEQREADLEEASDGWKVLAQGTTPELKRLNDLLETAIRLLQDPSRADRAVERAVAGIRTELDEILNGRPKS